MVVGELTLHLVVSTRELSKRNWCPGTCLLTQDNCAFEFDKTLIQLLLTSISSVTYIFSLGIRKVALTKPNEKKMTLLMTGCR